MCSLESDDIRANSADEKLTVTEAFPKGDLAVANREIHVRVLHVLEPNEAIVGRHNELCKSPYHNSM